MNVANGTKSYALKSRARFSNVLGAGDDISSYISFSKMAQLNKEKIAKYESFVDNRLKPELVQAVAARDKVMERQRVFEEHKHAAGQRNAENEDDGKSGLEIYAQAEVLDTSSIYVDIGLGFHVEFKLDEALNFCAHKQELLSKEVEEHNKSIADIKAQVKLVQEGVRELMSIPEDRVSAIL